MNSIRENKLKYITYFLCYYISINNKLPAVSSTFGRPAFLTWEETAHTFLIKTITKIGEIMDQQTFLIVHNPVLPVIKINYTNSI